jgi:hypothetical protein
MIQLYHISVRSYYVLIINKSRNSAGCDVSQLPNIISQRKEPVNLNCTVEKIAAPEPFVLQRRIGSTLYKVGIYFNPEAKETLNEKVQRLLKNDLQSAPECVKMDSLQADWLSERGSA